MTNKCCGLMGLVFGHKFQTAHDSTTLPPTTEIVSILKACNQLFNKVDIPLGGATTVRAVFCSRCGQTVELHNAKSS